MSYEVLARKWRPQQFDAVVGQEHVTTTLQNAIKGNRIAHAYLFVGPRGTGKTSLARIFAKALNCVKSPTVAPCDACDSCREIAAGSSLDVREIDGASNNSVDQIRDLRDTVKYAPVHGAYKIYIIDEVHMLSASAFNALLKTLEEPPAHVKFFFATTEPEKVLPTIVSRCQRFDLRRIPVALIVERLRLVAAAEKVTADDDALLAVARGAEGGLRDAESALDQLISFKGERITEEDVLSVFALVSRRVLEAVAGHILKGDVRALIEAVAELDRAGKDLSRLVVELMDHFRNLLVLVHAPDFAQGLDLTEPQIAALRQQAVGADPARLLRISDILAETQERMRFALSRRILLETALIRCARAAVVVTLEEILRRIQELRGPGQASPAPRAGPAPAAAAAALPPARPAAAAADAGAAGGGVDEAAALAAGWRQIVDRIGKMALMAKGPLADARPAEVTKDRVVIEFDREFGVQIEQFDLPRNRKAVETVLRDVLKREVAVGFRVSETSWRDNGPPAPAKPVEAAGSPVEAAGPRPAERTKSARDRIDDPAARKVLEMFKGSLVDSRE